MQKFCLLLLVLLLPVLLLPYSQKYWQEFNLVVEPKIAIANYIGWFKFGGSVWDRHTYICEQEILADFNLAIAQAGHQTAKFNSQPNFQLYGSKFYTSH